jgi:hypothetical protein
MIDLNKKAAVRLPPKVETLFGGILWKEKSNMITHLN